MKLFFIVTFYLASLMVCVTLSLAGTENYSTEKIVLGEFKVKNGFTDASTFSVPWLELETSHVAFDDSHKIYILDKSKKKVLQFTSEGKLNREITLSSVDFADKSEELGDEGYIRYQIKVSAVGSFIYVTEGGKENNWAVFDKNGKLIKKNIKHNWLQRRCNDKFSANDGSLELNNQLEIVNKITGSVDQHQNEVIDSKNSLYSLDLKKMNSNVLIKKTADGKQLWGKVIVNYKKALSLLGIDGDDCVYVLMDGPLKIIKINSDGEQIADIALPNVAFFKDWRYVSFNILCDGTVFCVPTHYCLWQELRNSTAAEYEYMIYKFQKLMFSSVSDLIVFFKIKNYEGNIKKYAELDINNHIQKFEKGSGKLSVMALRNEIFARHGRLFSSFEMKQIFESAPWYKPRNDFKESDLNEIEKKNVELISDYEKKMGWK